MTHKIVKIRIELNASDIKLTEHERLINIVAVLLMIRFIEIM